MVEILETPRIYLGMPLSFSILPFESLSKIIFSLNKQNAAIIQCVEIIRRYFQSIHSYLHSLANGVRNPHFIKRD